MEGLQLQVIHLGAILVNPAVLNIQVMASQGIREVILQALAMVGQDIPEDSIRPQVWVSQATLTLPAASIQDKEGQVILLGSIRVQDRVILEVTTREQEAIQAATTQEEEAILEAITPAQEATLEVVIQASTRVAIPLVSTTLQFPRNPVACSDSFWLVLVVVVSAVKRARGTCLRQRTPSMVEYRWPVFTA